MGGMVNRSSRALPQDGQRRVSFSKAGESWSGRGRRLSFSRSNRRADRIRRWDEPKKPK